MAGFGGGNIQREFGQEPIRFGPQGYVVIVVLSDEPTQVDESDTRLDRNLGCGIINRSNGKIIITPHLITIHFISTMGCNFAQLFDPIGSDYRIRSNSNTIDPHVIKIAQNRRFYRDLVA